MAYLLNRNSSARFECLLALVKFIYVKFGSSNFFKIKDVKFNREEQNIHDFCSLLVDSPIGTKYCIYKQNPLDEAGCALTNGINEDTTKSKEVSNTINALHALGFVTRNGRNIKITSLGIEFAKAKYGTSEMQEIIRKSILNYGPIIGIISQIKQIENSKKEFNSKDIEVGYPNTSEIIKYKNHIVELSSGSQHDSNTRTRSCLLTWLTTGGIIRPKDLPQLEVNEYAHSKYRDILNQPHRVDHVYVVVEDIDFTKKIVTQNPLDYSNLTKMTTALRENNQAVVREATIKYETKIKNRRFAIIYFLNEAFNDNSLVSFDNLLSFFCLHEDLFLISDQKLSLIFQKEIGICNMAGIPFDFIEKEGSIFMKPLTGINMEELSTNVPLNLLETLKSTKL
jgi:hypothetical protein